MTMLDQMPRTTAAAGNRRELLKRLLSQPGSGPSGVGGGTSPVPSIDPDPARRGEPFPLTEIQQAYWIGRSAAYDFGDVSIHAYVEVDGDDVDLPRLERSWQGVVERHDMLRAVVLPDGQQRILRAVPGYQLRVADLRGHDGEQVAGALAATREELSHQVLDAYAWPGFDIRATLLGGGRTRVHISIDLLHIDGGSLMILIDDWMRLYRDGAAYLPPLELSYRDYALGEIALRDTEVYRRSTQYWQERIRTLPPAPALPVVAARDTAAGTRFRRRSATLVLWVLLVGLPVAFISVSVAVTPDDPASVELVENAQRAVQVLLMSEVHGAIMVPITVAFLAGLAGLFVVSGSAEGDRRLVLAGFRAGEVLTARLGVIVFAAMLTTAVSLAVTAISFTPESWTVFVLGNLLVALTYGMIGVLLGPLFGRLGGLYLMLMLPFIDAGLAQNPMFDAAPPAWAKFMPAHGAVRVLLDGAFTGGFDETGALLLAIGWLVAITGAAAVVFRRLAAPTRA